MDRFGKPKTCTSTWATLAPQAPHSGLNDSISNSGVTLLTVFELL